jgi:hypothetical protein
MECYNEHIAILGNGPSLALFWTDCAEKPSTIVLTNRLLFNSEFSKLKNVYYVFHEQRLLESKEFLLALSASRFPVVVRNKNSFFSLKERQHLNSTNVRRMEDLLGLEPYTSNVLCDYVKAFPLPRDLLRNVVLDVAIPMALSLKGSRIVLYGCDFEYNKETRYSDALISPSSFKFDHTHQSMRSWARFSSYRYKRVQDFCMNLNVQIERRC